MNEIKIIRSNRKTMTLEITADGQIIVRAPLRMKNEQIRSFVQQKQSWIEKHLAEIENRKSEQKKRQISMEELHLLAEKACKELPPKVEMYAKQIGVTYGRITIRNQKTRWGSCSSKGNLNFNCLLMLFPEEIQDYVIVHELCHRKEMNHSSVFWREVEKILPDYKERRKMLKELGSTIDMS